MRLAGAPAKYDAADQAQMRAAIQRADQENVKKQSAVDYILLSKPDGTVGKLTVDAGGVLHWTAL